MNEFYVIMFDNNTFFCNDELKVWYHSWDINKAVRFTTEALACNAIRVNKLPTNKIKVLRKTELDLTPVSEPVYHYVIVLENKNYYSIDSWGGVPEVHRAAKFDTREEAEYSLRYCDSSTDTIVYARTDEHEEEEQMIFEDTQRTELRFFEAAKFSVSTGERTSVTKYFSSIELGDIESRNMGWYNSPGTFQCMEPMVELTHPDGSVLVFAVRDQTIVISETAEERKQREENLRQNALSKLTLEEKIALGLVP